MAKSALSYPKARQIAANPKDAEQYIAELVRKVWRLESALKKIAETANAAQTK